MNITYFPLSEQGLRDNNEDYCHVEMLAGGSDVLAIVADGVGGQNAGKVASMVTCRAISEFLAQLNNIGLEDLRMSMTTANNDVIELQKNPRYENMATVVSACVISPKDNVIHICHVGDTRIYALCSDGIELSKLTKDHSFVGRLFDEKIISETEYMHHPKRNRIDKCIGSRPLNYFSDYLFAASFELAKFSRLLLCSDGLYDVVSSSDIHSILTQNPCTKKAAEELVKRALESGSHDNISAIVINL